MSLGIENLGNFLQCYVVIQNFLNCLPGRLNHQFSLWIDFALDFVEKLHVINGIFLSFDWIFIEKYGHFLFV